MLDFTITGQLRQAAGEYRFAGACAACLALALGGGPVALAAPASPVRLPPWIVEEARDPAQPAVREDAFAALLGPASAVPAADWSGRPVATLAEALRGVPGLLLQESFGGFEPPRISLRGSGLDSAPTARGVALLVDGLPLARADGSFHSGLFDPLLFSCLEIYRGSLHTALTPAVLGGVFNAVSFARESAVRTAVRAEGGEFGRLRGQFSWATPTAALSASVAEARGWREHNRQDRRALLGGGRMPLGNAVQLELSTYLAEARYEVPGPLTRTDAQTRPRAVSAAVARDLPRRDSAIARWAAQVRSHGPPGVWAAGAAWQRLRDDFLQLQANGETVSVSDDFAAQVTTAHRVSGGGWEHHLLVRGTFSSGENRVDRFLNERGGRGALFGAFAGRARTLALSVEDRIQLRSDLAAGVGTTVLSARREIVDRAIGPAVPPLGGAVSTSELAPRAGLTWSGSAGLGLRVGVSRGVEPPAFDDLVSVQGRAPHLVLHRGSLRAQRATTLEMGAQGSWRRLNWDVSAYQGRWSDEILRLADASGSPRGAVNAGRTRHDGVETGLRWRVSEHLPGLTLAATSTLGRFTFARDPVYGSNRLAGAPPHVGSAALVYEPPRGWY
ncbi:MAG: TonB-dependent receptor, partial [Verrucomicrobia bacterium]|nr:TonB-dependent receptor [Verrucomicrobiota bacterium]